MDVQLISDYTAQLNNDHECIIHDSDMIGASPVNTNVEEIPLNNLPKRMNDTTGGSINKTQPSISTKVNPQPLKGKIGANKPVPKFPPKKPVMNHNSGNGTGPGLVGAGVGAVLAGASALTGGTDTSTGDYYNIFGFQLSRTTVYIILAIIALVAFYYLYKYFVGSKSSDKNVKKKRNPVVSHDEQIEHERKEEKDNNDDKHSNDDNNESKEPQEIDQEQE